jgi:CHASE2 domain-containing sensor protein
MTSHSASSRPHHPTPKEIRIRTEEIFVDVILAAVIAVAIGWVLSLFAGGAFMHWAEYSTQELIQHVLAAHPASKNVPIMVVDLSKIEVAPIPGAQHSEEATPREPLKQLLTVLTSITPPPRAIGIDLDFAPQETYRTPQDPAFFDFCLKLRQQTGIPIYLGVFSTQARPADQWLLNPKYKELGASILAPQQTENMVQCFQAHADSECGPSMSGALAAQLKPAPPHFVARHPHYFEELSTRRLSQNISLRTFPVDYGTVSLLMSPDHTVPSTDPQIIHSYAAKISNRIVLIGDVSSPSGSDVFRIPGHDQLIPGIYVHAAAIYTLAQAPLYEFTPFARTLMDLATFSLTSAIIMWIRWRYRRRSKQANTHRVSAIITYASAIIITVFGIGVVHRTRLLWPDFLVGIILSIIELHWEHYLIEAFHWIWHRGPHAAHQLLAEEEK